MIRVLVAGLGGWVMYEGEFDGLKCRFNFVEEPLTEINRHLRYARWCLVVWGRRFIMDSRCATCKERPKIAFNVAAFANPFRCCGAG